MFQAAPSLYHVSLSLIQRAVIQCWRFESLATADGQSCIRPLAQCHTPVQVVAETSVKLALQLTAPNSCCLQELLLEQSTYCGCSKCASCAVKLAKMGTDCCLVVLRRLSWKAGSRQLTTSNDNEQEEAQQHWTDSHPRLLLLQGTIDAWLAVCSGRHVVLSKHGKRNAPSRPLVRHAC